MKAKKSNKVSKKKVTKKKVTKKVTKKNNKKVTSRLTDFQVLLIALLLIVLYNVCLFILFRPKFQDVTVELGTDKIDLNSFVTSKMYRKNATCLTDVDEIDLYEVGSHDITFTFQDLTYVVKLNVVDTTPPKVKFNDNIEVGTNYEFNVEDFVKSVDDLSEYEIRTDFKVDAFEVKDYKVKVDVVDEYNNITSKELTLKVKFARTKINHELGDKLDYSEFIYNPNDYAKLNKEDFASLDVNQFGEQNLTYVVDGKEHKLSVTVIDTKAPDLVVKNLVYYFGDKEYVEKDFVKSCNDASGVCELTYEGKFDYKKVGSYDLNVTATDSSGNTVTKTAKLTVKADKNGPVFKGLTNLKLEKGSTVDWNAGVKAIDARDGEMKFTVDASKVDLNNSGIYYAIYTSKDLSENVTTVKRRVEIKHNAEDTERLAREYYDKYLVGKTPLQMTQYIRRNLSFENKTRTDDGLYEALTAKRASCYGRAMLLERALTYAGYSNYMVCTDPKYKNHCWNLVYYNGQWCHYDSTPGNHIVLGGETKKANSYGMAGRKWDTAGVPKASNDCPFVAGNKGY